VKKTRPMPKIETVPIGDLSPDPANLREHDARNRDTIRASLRRFGAGRSVVIDAHGMVVAGNGTLAEAREAGIGEVLIVDPEPGQIVAVRRKEWTATEATAYAIADNRSTDLSSFRDDDLAETLRSLELDGFDLDDVGFNAEELKQILGDGMAGEVVDDPAGEWGGMPECENGDETAFRSITVHFKSEDDAQAFAELLGQKVTDRTKFLWHPPVESVDWTDRPYVNEP
jgi:hypothetical protein